MISISASSVDHDVICWVKPRVDVLLCSVVLSLPSYCVRVNPSMANRLVDSARSILNQYLPDVYIYTDIVKGTEAGK